LGVGTLAPIAFPRSRGHRARNAWPGAVSADEEGPVKRAVFVFLIACLSLALLSGAAARG